MKPAESSVEKSLSQTRHRRVKKKRRDSDSEHEKNESKSTRKLKRKHDSCFSIDSNGSDAKEKENKNNTVDLSKYKDEYKTLIQSVKTKMSDNPDKKNKKNVKNPPLKSSQCSATEPLEICNKQNTKQSSMDAFQFMMEARKKSIGVNSPGKEATEEVESKNAAESKELKAKRTLALSLWADKKGASEKRELEEQRDEDIKHTLQKRADSFKQMLQKGSKRTTKKSPESQVRDALKDYEDIFVTKKQPKRVKRQAEAADLPVQAKKESTDETIKADSKADTTKKLRTHLLPETNETFLDKLSPSIKKSESVLCYFEKAESSKQGASDNKSGNSNNAGKSGSKDKCTDVLSGKKRSKSRQKQSTQDINQVTTESIPSAVHDSDNPDDKVIPPNNTDRPRRSVRKPIKYAQDTSDSSEESDYENMFTLETKQPRNRKARGKPAPNSESLLTIEIDDKVSPIKIINLQSPGQMKCVKSPRSVKPASEGKLAPLFMKSLPKPKVDPGVMEARRLFLQSGVPENMKKRLEKTLSSVSLEVNEFIPVVHVQQKSDHHVWSLAELQYILDISDHINDVNFADLDKNSLTLLNLTCKDSQKSLNSLELFKNLEHIEIKHGLKTLKQTFPNFPVYNTYKQLWSKFLSGPKSNSQDSGVFVDDASNTCDNNTNSSAWTEKYKPLSSHDIIGNFQAVSSIKKWLTSWKEHNEANKSSRRTRKTSSSSSDFDMSDSESRDSCKTPSNVMVITGPPGSGKTSTIYAICNELSINVLEINASSKRTGKKILSEMHEATQSHKVKVKQNSEQTFSGLFNKGKCEATSNDLPASKKNNCSKVIVSEKVSDSQKKTETHISLMLIDDVDIVFEEDDGFVNGLSQLVQSSKRPVLLVASDENCSHLQRFKTDYNLIKFKPFSGKILGPWIDILLLIECNKIIPKLSSNLLELNRGDARKSILQMQYWILGNKPVCIEDNILYESSGAEELSNDDTDSTCVKDVCDDKSNINTTEIKKLLLSELSPYCNLERVWWNLQSVLISNPTENADKKKFKEQLKHLHNYIDTYSSIDLLQACAKCPIKLDTLSLWQRVVKDSTSESENMTMYRGHTNLTNEICNYLHEISPIETLCDHNVNLSAVTHIDSLDIRVRERQLDVYEEFSQGVSLTAQLDRSSMSMDYMSTLRVICRSESARSSSNLKRNNRFHNYLNTLNIFSNVNTMNNACKILNQSN